MILDRDDARRPRLRVALRNVQELPCSSNAYRLHWSTMVLVAIIVGLISGCTDFAQGTSDLDWRRLGTGLIHHSPVLTLAYDPDRPQVMYAGSYHATGLYRSEDGGQTWAEASYGLEGPVYTLLTIPTPSGSLFVAGTDNGLYRRIGEGSGWQRVADLPNSMAVYTLVQDTGGTLYLGGSQPYIFRSRDGGQNWQALAPLAEQAEILSLNVSADGKILLAGTSGQGLFISRNEGRTWQLVEEVGETFVADIQSVCSPCVADGKRGTPVGDEVHRSVTKQNLSSIYARTRRGLFYTIDGGQTWLSAAGHIVGRIDALALDATSGWLYLATGDGRIFRSKEGSVDWEQWGQGIAHSGAVFTLHVAADGSGTFYAGTFYGLYRSEDEGQTWQRIEQGPGNSSPSALAMAPDGSLYLGTVGGVYASTDGGERWGRLGVGLPESEVVSLVVSPSNPQILYAGFNGQGLYRSTDSGQTWTAGGLDGLAVMALAVHPTAPEQLFARVAFERVYASEDGGQTWTTRWNGLDLSTEIISLTINPHRPQILYAGGTQALYKSRDSALSWQKIGAVLEGQTVFVLAVERSDREWLYAGATHGVYRSTDGGRQWSRWGMGLEEITVTALAFHPHRAQVVYVGTKYHGVYRSGDGGHTWQPAVSETVTNADTRLGVASVNGLAVSPDGRWLFAATSDGFYRGVAR